MQPFDVIAGCATDKGEYREKNQDRIISLTAGSGKNILTLSCICDGIGSLKMSEIASEMMTSGLSVWLNRVKDYYPEIMNGTDMADSLEEEIKRLNESIYEYRMSCENAIGCTMSVIFTAGDDYYIFHILSKTIIVFLNHHRDACSLKYTLAGRFNINPCRHSSSMI